jgi:hypothetical protein
LVVNQRPQLPVAHPEENPEENPGWKKNDGSSGGGSKNIGGGW